MRHNAAAGPADVAAVSQDGRAVAVTFDVPTVDGAIDVGQVASSVTGLYPWLGYQATDRLTVWGVAGYGAGGLMLTPAGGPALASGLSMKMAAAGTRGDGHPVPDGTRRLARLHARGPAVTQATRRGRAAA